MFRILLDPGHGPGKAHNRGGLYFNEGDNNFAYALVLKKELEKLGNVVVNLTRTANGNPTLHARAKMGAGYDLFLSLHSNGGPAQVRGTEVFDSVERPNKALAQKLSLEIAKVFNHNNRGAKYKEGQPGFNWYGVLRLNKAKSSMIVEHGFHSNKADGLFFRDNKLEIATKTTEVIAQHYGLKRQETGSNQGGINVIYYRIGSPHNTKTAVKNLQNDLIKLGFPVGRTGADGSFGPATRDAVIKYQKSKGLKADGSAGPDTLSAIKKDLNPKPVAPQPTKGLYKVQTGAFGDKKNAEALAKQLEKLGFKTYITYE